MFFITVGEDTRWTEKQSCRWPIFESLWA